MIQVCQIIRIHVNGAELTAVERFNVEGRCVASNNEKQKGKIPGLPITTWRRT